MNLLLLSQLLDRDDDRSLAPELLTTRKDLSLLFLLGSEFPS